MTLSEASNIRSRLPAPTLALLFEGEASEDRLSEPMNRLAENADHVVRVSMDDEDLATRAAASAVKRGNFFRTRLSHPRLLIVGEGSGMLAATMAAVRWRRHLTHVLLLGKLGTADTKQLQRTLSWLSTRPPARSCVLTSPDAEVPEAIRTQLDHGDSTRWNTFPEWLPEDEIETVLGHWVCFEPKVHGGYPIKVEAGKSYPAWSVQAGEAVTWAMAGGGRFLHTSSVQTVTGEEVDQVSMTIHPQPPGMKTPWTDGPGYIPAGTWTPSTDMAPGVYLLDGRPDLFTVVRRPDRRRRITVLLSTNTFNAYSTTDGRSLYKHPIQVPAVSFCRPMDQVKSFEWLPLLQWLSAHPVYGDQHEVITDFEMEDPRTLDKADVLLVAGHSEYWSRGARRNFDAFVSRGGTALIVGGNTFWWQVRIEDDGRLLVSHKSNADPVTGPTSTTGWARPELEFPIVTSTGGDFEHGGFGATRRPEALSGPGMCVVSPEHPLLTSVGTSHGSWVDFGSVREFDGMPIRGFAADGYPVPDYDSLASDRAEILAYGWGHRGGMHTLGTCHVFQPARAEGTVVHFGFKEAAGLVGPGGSPFVTGLLTNALEAALSGSPLLSGQRHGRVAYELTTPANHVPQEWPNPAQQAYATFMAERDPCETE